MITQCLNYPCQRTTAGCAICDRAPVMQAPFSIPSPRILPVNIPFSNFGITVVTMDRDGNTTIKVEQPEASPA